MLAGLLKHLPGESAYKTAVRDALDDDQLAALAGRQSDGSHGPWSTTDMHLAAVRDLLQWTIYAIYASQGGKPKQPTPTPRPGVARPKRRALSAEGFAYLQRLRDEHEAKYGDGSQPDEPEPDAG